MIRLQFQCADQQPTFAFMNRFQFGQQLILLVTAGNFPLSAAG